MVQLRYKGQNTLFIGGYKIVAGLNDIKDEDFYRLMASKTFRLRVESRILEVPKGFAVHRSSKVTLPEDKADEIESSAGEDRQSVRSVLKTIESSEDEEFLKKIAETDGRNKIMENAKKRLQAITEAK